MSLDLSKRLTATTTGLGSIKRRRNGHFAPQVRELDYHWDDFCWHGNKAMYGPCISLPYFLITCAHTQSSRLAKGRRYGKIRRRCSTMSGTGNRCLHQLFLMHTGQKQVGDGGGEMFLLGGSTAFTKASRILEFTAGAIPLLAGFMPPMSGKGEATIALPAQWRCAGSGVGP